MLTPDPIIDLSAQVSRYPSEILADSAKKRFGDRNLPSQREASESECETRSTV